jgi:hypothetical protein
LIYFTLHGYEHCFSPSLRAPSPSFARLLSVIARSHPSYAGEKRKKDEKKRLVNIMIISGYIFRHCERSEAIQAQATARIASLRSLVTGKYNAQKYPA